MEQVQLLKTILKIFRVFLIIVAICLVVFLIYQDFVPSGILIVENTIKERSAIFSDFYPNVRIREIECDEAGECWRTMTCDPLYFDITIPRNFDKARVIIEYKKDSEQEIFQIGLRKKGNEWNFQLKPLEKLENVGGWETAGATFSIPPEYIIDRQLKFMLSAPEMDINRREIQINSIQVILEREPITWQNFYPRFKNYLVKLLNRET